MNYDTNFIDTFNDYYPFDRYIVKNPKPINYLFDDVKLKEIFVPATEIKPVVIDGEFIRHTEIDDDEIYVKLECNGNEFRMAYYDFNEGVRETIRNIVLEDLGEYEWQSLYVDYDDESEYDDIKIALKEQHELITQKYGECKTKPFASLTVQLL